MYQKKILFHEPSQALAHASKSHCKPWPMHPRATACPGTYIQEPLQALTKHPRATACPATYIQEPLHALPHTSKSHCKPWPMHPRATACPGTYIQEPLQALTKHPRATACPATYIKSHCMP